MPIFLSCPSDMMPFEAYLLCFVHAAGPGGAQAAALRASSRTPHCETIGNVAPVLLLCALSLVMHTHGHTHAHARTLRYTHASAQTHTQARTRTQAHACAHARTQMPTCTLRCLPAWADARSTLLLPHGAHRACVHRRHACGNGGGPMGARAGHLGRPA